MKKLYDQKGYDSINGEEAMKISSKLYKPTIIDREEWSEKTERFASILKFKTENIKKLTKRCLYMSKVIIYRLRLCFKNKYSILEKHFQKLN